VNPVAPALTWLRRRSIYIAVLHLGACAAVAQILLVRELLTVSQGNELILGFIYASWFLGVFIGARFGPRRPEHLERSIIVSLLLMPLLLVPVLSGIMSLPALVPMGPGVQYPLHMEMFFSVSFITPSGFFTGYFFPPAVAILSEEAGDAAGGRVYCIESLGSFAGALVFSLILVDTVNPLGCAMILLMVSLAITSLRGGTLRRATCLLLPLLLVPAFFSRDLERLLMEAVWNNSHTGRLVDYRRTRHQMLVLESLEEQVSLYGNGALHLSLPDRHESRHLFHLAQSLRREGPHRILLFGLGPGSLPYNLSRTGSVVHVVETDPETLPLLEPHMARLYPGMRRGGTVSFIADDMRHFLASGSGTYHAIISAPPPPRSAMINRYYTVEYFRLCREHLAPGGVMIAALPGYGGYIDETQRGLVASIYKSFAAVFPLRLVGAGERILLVGAISSDILPETTAGLIERYRERPHPPTSDPLEPEISENFSPGEMSQLFDPAQEEYLMRAIGPLLPEAPENRDGTPGAYWLQILHGSLQENSPLYPILSREYIIIIVLAAFFCAGTLFVAVRGGPSHGTGGITIALTGCVSITLVLAMILIYQNLYGNLYYRIAAIQAAVMLGMAAGSAASSRCKTGTLVILFPALGAVALSLFLFTETGLEPVFWIILWISSCLCGSAFPLLYRVLSSGGPQAAASTLDSMDFLGSLCGAAAAPVLLPALGVSALIVLCALCSLSAAVPAALLLRTVRYRAPGTGE
jgi:spermidine synthase